VFKFSLLIPLLVWLAPASAASVDPPVQIGSKLIAAGDTRAKVQEAGTPDRTQAVTNDFGVKVAEDWVFERGNHTITVRIDNSGNVVSASDHVD
jgi:hypothetical protein